MLDFFFFPLKEIFRFWINYFLKPNLEKTFLFGEGGKRLDAVELFIFFILYQEVMIVPEKDCGDTVSWKNVVKLLNVLWFISINLLT